MTGGGRGKKKKEKKRERRRKRESGGGGGAGQWGGGQGGGEWGNGGRGAGGGGGTRWWRRGKGTWWRLPPEIILPHSLLKALGPSSAATCKVAVIPWCVQVLQEGRAGDQPVFAGATHTHMTLEWVFRRRVRCQIRRQGETKGTWREDAERGGTWTWRPLPGEPMNPVPEAISVGSLSSQNVCGDPRGVQLGTAHFLVASSTGSRWGGAGNGDKERGSTLRCSGRRCWPDRG